MSGLTVTGFTAATVEEIRAEIEAELLADIDSKLDLSPSSPQGQIVGIVAAREARLWELLQTAYYALDPKNAEGWLLDIVANLVGVNRLRARASTVTIACTLANATTLTAGSAKVAHATDPSKVFVASETYTAVGAGTYPIEFRSVEKGPVVATAGTLTVIATPIAGWTAATNLEDATVGAYRENDTELRVRRETELTKGGSSGVDSIRTDVKDIEGVLEAHVYENVTNATDGDGLPAHSFETVVYDAGAVLDDTIAQVIWDGKPSGIATYGTTSGDATDSAGIVRTVNFTRATEVPVWIEVQVTVSPQAGSDVAQQVEEAILAKGNAHLTLGEDVVRDLLKAYAFTVAGVKTVPSLTLGLAPSPVGTADIAITNRQIARLDSSRILVTVV